MKLERQNMSPADVEYIIEKVQHHARSVPSYTREKEKKKLDDLTYDHQQTLGDVWGHTRWALQRCV